MIFSIQRFLEDYFERRGLLDLDQYAVKVANLYGRLRPTGTDEALLHSMRRVRTAFFRNNVNLNRVTFERDLLAVLDRQFQKKSLLTEFPGGISRDRAYLQRRRKSMWLFLDRFRQAVESRAVDVLWQSRKKGRLLHRPEHIGQGLLAIFFKGILDSNTHGLVLREMYSGTGFVDVAIVFTKVPHLVEIKVLTSRFTGASQLQTYMRMEGRKEGWLLLFDARSPNGRVQIPDLIDTEDGRIRILLVDINPIPPSRK